MQTNILGCYVDRVDMSGAMRKIETFIASGTPHHIITLNAEIIHKAQKDSKLKDIINQAHLVTPDGSGVVWAAEYLNSPVPERVTGIDLTLELARIGAAEGWSFYLYGAAPGVATATAEKLQEKYNDLKVIGTNHGFLSDTEKKAVIEDIKSKKPDILLVALGAPNQEYWISEHLKELQVPVCMGVGGSFDVISGKAKRAPKAFQKAGLEWFYRLIKEPHRMGRIMALPRFVIMVRLKGKKHTNS